MAIDLKSQAELELMQKADAIVAEVLSEVRKQAVPGVTTLELDSVAEELTQRLGAKPAFKGYKGAGPYPFPACLCTSINEEVVHGIPSSDRRLTNGDVLSVDFGVVYEGFYGDAAITIPIGQVSESAKQLLKVTEESLNLAIEQVVADNRISDIGAAIQDYVEKFGFSVVRDFVGHGIGRALHEEPQIPHYRTNGHNERLRPGMVLAIEPMVNQGTWEVETGPDGWTQLTKDRKISAHFEHSVAVTRNGPLVLSRLPVGH